MWNPVKIGQMVSEKMFKDYTILYTYLAQRQGQVTPEGQNVYCNWKAYYLNHKFQPLVFNTFWENDLSTLSPYKCIGMQIWPCCKKVKDQPMIIVWTDLVDLESLMLCTKSQPQAFLVLKKWIFKCFTIYGHGGYLNQQTVSICINFQSPFNRRLHMQFEEISPKGFRGGHSKVWTVGLTDGEESQ